MALHLAAAACWPMIPADLTLFELMLPPAGSITLLMTKRRRISARFCRQGGRRRDTGKGGEPTCDRGSDGTCRC